MILVRLYAVDDDHVRLETRKIRDVALAVTASKQIDERSTSVIENVSITDTFDGKFGAIGLVEEVGTLHSSSAKYSMCWRGRTLITIGSTSANTSAGQTSAGSHHKLLFTPIASGPNRQRECGNTKCKIKPW
jgi:hypothetical protein